MLVFLLFGNSYICSEYRGIEVEFYGTAEDSDNQNDSEYQDDNAQYVT